MLLALSVNYIYVSDTRNKLNSALSDVDQTVRHVEQLTVQLSIMQDRISALNGDVETLKEDSESVNDNIRTTLDENFSLKTALAAAVEELEVAIIEKDIVYKRLETATYQLNSTLLEYDALQEATGQLDLITEQQDELSKQVTLLQAEIENLKSLRSPLIVDSYAGHFKCTGSMEPKITCLDEAIWLMNFDPEDIIVGSVISFKPNNECDFSSAIGNRSHRVTSVKQESDIYYFKTKGDANEMDDGCWIPQQDVEGYIIDLRKNAVPNNAALRNMVNEARSTLETAFNQHSSMTDTYQNKKQQYHEKYATYITNCTVDEFGKPQYGYNAEPCSVIQYELDQLWPDLIKTGNELTNLNEEYTEAFNSWRIAYAEALAS